MSTAKIAITMEEELLGNLDPKFEKALAEGGISRDMGESPEYKGVRFTGPT